MVTLRNFIIATFGLFLLTQCNSKEDNPTDPSSAVTKVDHPLVGDWKYNNTIWYSSELTLHEDGTFIYHDQSCNRQRFSQGQWTIANSLISLISFDPFKQKERIEPTKTVEVTEQQKTKRRLKKGQMEYSFVGFKETTAPTYPSASDIVNVYFNDIQLQLRNDTLYCVSSNKLLEKAKFYRTKNNR